MKSRNKKNEENHPMMYINLDALNQWKRKILKAARDKDRLHAEKQR